MSERPDHYSQLDRLLSLFKILGAFGILLAAARWASDGSETMLKAYLFGFVFWTQLSLGCLGLLLIHHLTAGAWGFAIQRLLENGAKMLVVMGLLSIPILLNLESIFEWADLNKVAGDAILQHKQPYLNAEGFQVRTVGFFAFWSVLTWLLVSTAKKLDAGGEPVRLVGRLKSLSGPGLAFFILTLSFASFDWMMSLDPHWYSSLYGLMVLVGSGLLAMSFTICVFYLLSNGALAEVAGTKQFHDLGNLLLALVMLWAYLTFSQWLIIYSGNLPEEIVWYLARSEHGWLGIVELIALFHFGIPFVILLSRHSKRNAKPLFLLAAAMVFIRSLEIFWLMVPGLHHGIHLENVPAAYVATPLVIGAVWVHIYVFLLRRSRPLADGDPRFAEALEAAAHAH